MQKSIVSFGAGLFAAGAVLSSAFAGESVQSSTRAIPTATPIKHLVVIFEENVSFDHYFGTYPNASNPSGEPRFTAAPGTPSVNGLTGVLLTNNPNATNPVNAPVKPILSGWTAVKPRRPTKIMITRPNNWPSITA